MYMKGKILNQLIAIVYTYSDNNHHQLTDIYK